MKRALLLNGVSWHAMMWSIYMSGYRLSSMDREAYRTAGFTLQ